MRLKELCPQMDISVQTLKRDQFLFGVGNKGRKKTAAVVYITSFQGRLLEYDGGGGR